MPIFVTDYYWNQSSENVFLKIELQGAKKSSINILQSENFIKVSFPPYIFEKPTWAKIIPDKTFVTLENGSVSLKCFKAECKEWPALSADLPIDKIEAREFMTKLRNEAVSFSQQDAEEKREERIADKNKKDRFSVSQQIKLEQDEKKRIEDFKNEEKKRVTDEILKFQKETEQKPSYEQTDELKRQWEHYRKLETELENIDSDEDEKRVIAETKSALKPTNQKSETTKTENQIEIDQKPNNKTVNEVSSKQKQIFDANEVSQPAIRGSGNNIAISFTPRVFPTPLRESRKPEEDEWLRKQAEARQRANDASSDLTDIEKDPVLLRQKGNSFFRQENYQGAVNVFTHGINLYPKMPEFYSNRAACHLKLRNFFKALDDSSKAIELLTPPCEANAKDRTKAHVRRGTAFCELECYAEGLIEYEAALKCEPTNEQIQNDCQKLRKYIEGTYTGDLQEEDPYEREKIADKQKLRQKSRNQKQSDDESSDDEDDVTDSENSENENCDDDVINRDGIVIDDVTKMSLKGNEVERSPIKAHVTTCVDDEDSDDVDE